MEEFEGYKIPPKSKKWHGLRRSECLKRECVNITELRCANCLFSQENDIEIFKRWYKQVKITE